MRMFDTNFQVEHYITIFSWDNRHIREIYSASILDIPPLPFSLIFVTPLNLLKTFKTQTILNHNYHEDSSYSVWQIYNFPPYYQNV